MEPRIQYAKTADGVSIAFWTLGEGMPLVQMPTMPFSHVQLEWQWPEYRRWYERLAEKRMLVRYDSRGSGLSDRDVARLSLDDLVLDLEAVVGHLGYESVALIGAFHSGMAAIAHAALHAERVSHLVLWHSWARTADTASPQLRGLRQLLDADWELYTETTAHVILGWAAGEEARRMATVYRESVTQQTMQAFLDGTRNVDVTELMREVRSPTLVLHRREVPWLRVDLARRVASRIPEARLVVLEGTGGVPFLGDTEAVLRALDDFLGDGEEPPSLAAAPSGLVTILFTDMESSTTLTQRLGDTKAQDLLRTHNTIVRDALMSQGGSEVKHTGDGIMASFPSASQALRCAIAIQRAVAAQADTPLRVRVGLNTGEPVAEEQDLFGTAVQVAHRICDRAEPGQILVSNVVRELAAGKGFLFSDHGDVELRGFEDPVRLFEVRWRERPDA